MQRFHGNQRPEQTPELETQAISTTLDTNQWVLHGRRARIFVLAAGSGTICHRNEDFPLQTPSIVWVPSGQSTTLTLHAGSRGAWLAISTAAMAQLALPENIVMDFQRLATRALTSNKIEQSHATQLMAMMSVIDAELGDEHAAAQEIVRYQLAIVCILLWRHSNVMKSALQPAPRALANSFLDLVEQQMRSHWKVADYARKLGVTTDRLNTTIQRATGKSPLEVIHTRLLSEAKWMLEASGSQISQIAAYLGFDDPAYFSRFFRRQSGKSPRQYRADFLRNQIRSDQSFAAWP